MRITIEPEPSRTSRCDCCGGVTTNLTRLVYRDGGAYAVYYAAFSDNHSDGVVTFLGGHLSRDEALAHPLVNDVFRLTDVIVHEDADIHAYFERTGGCGGHAESATIH